MNGDRRFNFKDAFTHIEDMLEAEVKLMKNVYRSYGWSYLIKLYYDSYDEMYETIEQMEQLPNQRFPYAIVLIKTLIDMNKLDNDFHEEWRNLKIDMIDALCDYDVDRYVEFKLCERLYYDGITQEVYEELNQDIYGENNVQRRLQTYFENFNDIKWTRLVNECTEAKPICRPQKLIRLGNDIAMK